MSEIRTPETRDAGATRALSLFGEGMHALEEAYRELWSARVAERREHALRDSERVRDLCHEIRNPLSGVRGLSTLLRRELDARPSTPRSLRLLDTMERGLASIDELLGHFRDEEAGPTDAGSVAEEVAALAVAENRARGGDVRFAVRAREGIELPVAATTYRTILANLVRNAAEACGPEGRVRITIESSADEIVTVVEDDGCGLPVVPDRELFRRGFSTNGGERGRGLAQIAALVDANGGALHFCRKRRGTIARARLVRR